MRAEGGDPLVLASCLLMNYGVPSYVLVHSIDQDEGRYVVWGENDKSHANELV